MSQTIPRVKQQRWWLAITISLLVHVPLVAIVYLVFVTTNTAREQRNIIEISVVPDTSTNPGQTPIPVSDATSIEPQNTPSNRSMIDAERSLSTTQASPTEPLVDPSHQRDVPDWHDPAVLQAFVVESQTSMKASSRDQIDTRWEETREAYIRSWSQKVHRIAQLNYPAEAKHNNLFGILTLSVSISATGELKAVAVRSGSGHRILDQAAVDIVHRATPFAPVPQMLLSQAGVFTFEPVWEYRNNQSLLR